MCSKTFFLNSVVLLSNKFQEQPLVQDVLPLKPIYMDEVESEFLKSLVWFRYIDGIVFIWTHGKEHLETFLQELSNFIRDLNFTYESDDKEISFLNLQVKLNEGKIRTCHYIKYTNRHQYLHFASSHLNQTKRSVVLQSAVTSKKIKF